MFGPGAPFVPGSQPQLDPGKGNRVFAFGSALGGEVKLPSVGGRGGFFVDWIPALVDESRNLREFVAVEVQSIDTTGNYRQERETYLREEAFPGKSTAGFNWENVNKRILPQIIYKGHVLRQEPLCQKGLFFVCPMPVYAKISERLGGGLRPYPIQPGSLTIMWYDIGPAVVAGSQRALVGVGQFTTTIDQVAHAFTAPSNLPPAQVYENAIRASLEHR